LTHSSLAVAHVAVRCAPAAAVDGNGLAWRYPIPFKTRPVAKNPSPEYLVDASLQAGTGSPDRILGTSYHQPVSE